MDASDLIAKVLAKREQWVDLEPGKRVKIRRPAEAEMPAMRRGMTPESVARHCVDWEGFTEADLLGAELAPDTKVKFDLDLWVAVALDRLDWIGAVSEKLVAAVSAHLAQRSNTAKN